MHETQKTMKSKESAVLEALKRISGHKRAKVE